MARIGGRADVRASGQDPVLIPSNTPSTGVVQIWQISEKIISELGLQGRIRTNPKTRVDLIRLRKNLELELKLNSFEKRKSSLLRGYHNLASDRPSQRSGERSSEPLSDGASDRTSDLASDRATDRATRVDP